MKRAPAFFRALFVILLSFAATFLSGSLRADDKGVTIRGKVVDAQNAPLPGVAVVLEGTTHGIATDENGNYSLTVASIEPGTVIEFSSIGYNSVRIVYNGSSTVNVTMEENQTFITEVVVTGYTDIKQESFTGNAVTIKGEDLLKASKTNVLKAIQSFDPSFRIKENNAMGSNPNSTPEMTIRGESGMGNFNQLDASAIDRTNLQGNPNLPTFIMDGFEVSATTLYDFDPNRIESITILKDAAATALYGSRAANGVVVITTVTPKPGKLNVSYNFVGGVTSPDLSDYDLLNAAEKLALEKKVGFYDIANNQDGMADEYSLLSEYYSKLANVKEGVDTYWLSQPLRSVFNHKHSLSVDGGTQNVRFGIDVSYANNDGVMKGSSRNNIGAGSYIQYIYKNLNIRNYVSYRQTDSKDSPYGTFSKYAQQLPYDRFKDENGKILETMNYWGSGTAANKENPLYESTLHNFSKETRDELTNRLSLIWDIIPFLRFKANLNLGKTTSKSDKFYDPLSKQSGNINPLDNSNASSGTYYLGNTDSFNIDFSSTLTYNTTVKHHAINALLGFEVREDNRTSNNITYIGFPSGILSSPMYAKEVYKTGNFYDDVTRNMGFLSSLNYVYRDTYLVDLSFRLDGSSSFGADQRFAPFWSAGLGVNIHEYEFIKNVNWINLLRVRGSFGQTGNANFPAYDSRSSYQILSDEWYKTGYGAVLYALGNSNLKWETTNTLDVGAEIGIFNDLVRLKGTYYDKRTVDLITAVTVPSSTGFSSYKDNIGEVSNKGYEFDLTANPLRTRDWGLNLNFRLAHNRNRIEKISDSMKAYNEKVIKMYNENLAYNNPDRSKQTTPFLQYVEGGSLSSIFGVQSLGINPATGEEVFVSRTGDVVKQWSSSDQVVLGTTEPKAQGSFGFNLTYKQLSLFTSFLYEFGAQRYNQTLVDKVENVNVYAYNVDRRVMEDRWMQPGDVAKYKKISTERNSSNFTKPTSRFVQDYNALSLGSVELSYSLPRRYCERIMFSNIRFTAGMSDVFHLQSIKMERGTSYPYARTMNFSVLFTL